MKLDRVAAWTLLGTMVLYLISGYGMTKGLISNTLAVNIHNNWLPIILLLSFCFHTCYAISVAFRRWKIWNPVTATLLVGFYLMFFGGFVYINSFYKKPITYKPASTTPTTTTQSNPSASGSSSSATTTQTTKTFTANELSSYNGQNGQPAYVAVNGKVYDVSDIFINGNHRGWSAGQDITTEFYRVHSDSFLTGLSVVGNYSG